MNTPNEALGTIKLRLMAIVLALLDDVPGMIEQTPLDRFTKKIIAELIQKQLPKMIENAVNKASEEDIEKQVLRIRDEIIPMILGKE